MATTKSNFLGFTLRLVVQWTSTLGGFQRVGDQTEEVGVSETRTFLVPAADNGVVDVDVVVAVGQVEDVTVGRDDDVKREFQILAPKLGRIGGRQRRQGGRGLGFEVASVAAVEAGLAEAETLSGVVQPESVPASIVLKHRDLSGSFCKTVSRSFQFLLRPVVVFAIMARKVT